MTGVTEASSPTPEEYENLVSDRDYFKHFSRLHENRAKASWKTLHKIERLITEGDYDKALHLLKTFLEVS